MIRHVSKVDMFQKIRVFNTMKRNHVIIAVHFDVCLKPEPLIVTANWSKQKHKILSIMTE